MKLIVICRYDRQKLNLALFAQAEAETSLGQQVLDRCWNWKGANGCEPGENHPWGHEWNLPKCSYNLIISRFWRWDSCDAGTPGGLLLLRCDCYTAWCGAEMMRQAASISNMPGTVVEFLINISFYFLISFWSAVWSFVWGMAQQRTAWIWHGAEARGFATLPEFNVRNLICLFRKYGRSETDQAFWCQCSTGSRYQASVPGMVLYVIIVLLALQDMCEVPLLGILEQAAFLRPTGASGEFGRRLCDRISVKEWQPPSRLHDFSREQKVYWMWNRAYLTGL